MRDSSIAFVFARPARVGCVSAQRARINGDFAQPARTMFVLAHSARIDAGFARGAGVLDAPPTGFDSLGEVTR